MFSYGECPAHLSRVACRPRRWVIKHLRVFFADQAMRVKQREALEAHEAARRAQTQEAAKSPRRLRSVYGKGRRDMLRSAYARRRKVDAVKGLLSTGDTLPHGATISDVLKPKRRHELQRSRESLATSSTAAASVRLQRSGTTQTPGHQGSADTLEDIAGGGDGARVRRQTANLAAAAAGLTLPALRASTPGSHDHRGDDSDDSWDDALLATHHADNVSDGGQSVETADWVDPATGLPGTPPLPKGTMGDPPRKRGLARRKAAARATLKAVQRRSALNAMTLRREALQGGVAALQAALSSSLSKGALTAEAQLAVRALLQGRGQSVLGGPPLKPERVFPNLTIAGLSNMQRTSNSQSKAASLQHGGLSLPSAGIAAQGMPGGPQLQLQPLVFPPLLESGLHKAQVQQLQTALLEAGVPHDRLQAMTPLIEAALKQPALEAADAAAWQGGEGGSGPANNEAEHALADAAAGGDVFAMTVAVGGLAEGAPSIARQRMSASKAPFRHGVRQAAKGGGDKPTGPSRGQKATGTSYIREMQQLREAAEVERQWRDRAVVALPPPMDQHQGGAGGGDGRQGAVLTGASALAASTSDPNLFAGDVDVGAHTDSVGTRSRQLLPGTHGRSATAGGNATRTALYSATSAAVSARRMSGGVRGGHANPYMHVTRGQAYPGAGGYRAESHAFRARDVTKELFAATWSTGGKGGIANDPTLPRVAFKGGGQIDHARTAEVRLERSARGLPQPKQTHTRVGGYRHGSRKASLQAALKGGVRGNNLQAGDASSDDYSSSDDEEGGAYALTELFPVYRRGLNHHSKYEEPASRDKTQRGVGGSQLPRQQQLALERTRRSQAKQAAAKVGARGVSSKALTLTAFRAQQAAQQSAGAKRDGVSSDAAPAQAASPGGTPSTPAPAAASPTGTLSLPLPATSEAFALDHSVAPSMGKKTTSSIYERLYNSGKKVAPPGKQPQGGSPVQAHNFLSREVHKDKWIGGSDFASHLSSSNVKRDEGAPADFAVDPGVANASSGRALVGLGGRDLTKGAKRGFLKKDGSRDSVGYLLYQSAVKAAQASKAAQQ